MTSPRRRYPPRDSGGSVSPVLFPSSAGIVEHAGRCGACDWRSRVYADYADALAALDAHILGEHPQQPLDTSDDV